MKDEAYIASLKADRDKLAGLLAPLEEGLLIDGDAQSNAARIALLRQQIAELDAIISREEAYDA
jgi:hypothetical protein